MASITATKLFGPTVDPGSRVRMKFELDIPSTGWLAAGNPIDLTSYFSYVDDAIIGAEEASGAYLFKVQVPNFGTAATNANVLLFAYYSNGSGGAMTVVPDTTDISAVTKIRLTVEGKPAAAAY
jgi:hypothetical protein